MLHILSIKSPPAMLLVALLSAPMTGIDMAPENASRGTGSFLCDASDRFRISLTRTPVGAFGTVILPTCPMLAAAASALGSIGTRAGAG
jgi:hypothetical protein